MSASVGVCGFGRCGSTMVMTMLDAGGLRPAGDVTATYELAGLEGIAAHIPCPGRSVKLLEYGIHEPPPSGEWHFVWLDRDPFQQAISQLKFARLIAGLRVSSDAVNDLAASLVRDRPRALSALRKQGSVLVLQYEQVLANASRAVRQLAKVAPDSWDRDAAVKAVHDRSPGCLPDCAVEERLARTTRAAS